MGTGDAGTDGVTGERRGLINVAYRLLGSVGEAEDAVQEAYARWFALPPGRREEIRVPGAWLTTVTGRICLDLLGSARARRERYVGAWLPEPLPDRAEWERAGGAGSSLPADPADQIVLDESVSMAFLVVLEAMTPAERVAFVLHDVFRYPFAEVAGVLGRTPAACKQLASSARRRLDGAGVPEAGGRADVVRRVKEAWESKDIGTLIALLDPAAVMTADGGGLAGTVPHPVEGGARIARYMAAIAGRAPGLELVERSVGGLPGLVARRAGVVETVASFDVSGGRVTRVWVVRNPEKLRPWLREG
ncbi:RNA polymerase sigma factor SigJ [Streptomyces sp. NPDC002734]|uniref:RNA polymerase sigma factor SigJ n=1 Tax=Streptomyces sp. NPDC002734 TaxID=3154426 RepID=UPI0033253847